MKVYILLCGLLRSFDDTLLPFLDELSNYFECKFILNVPKQKQKDDKFIYTEQDIQIEKISKHPNCFICIQHDPTISMNDITKREQSYLIQWNRIYISSQVLETFHPADNDIIIRFRPDMKINCLVTDFVQEIQECFKKQTIYISKNEETIFQNTFAMGPFIYMKEFCRFYETFSKDNKPFTYSLIDYLKGKEIPIDNFKVDSTIYLSKCKIIAITGDSGVGKSTLALALQKYFPFDSKLLLETDRYHKWERKSEEWSKTTHLNPDANYLEKLADDTFLLKLGEQVEHVDYNHSTGTFTAPEQIESKNYIFLCGLHTLYDNIRINNDINIFIDCEYKLKRFWKCRRDIQKRGYSLEKAIDIFEKRQHDYNKYILPQKLHADICIEYFTNDVLELDKLSFEPILLSRLIIKKHIVNKEIELLFHSAKSILSLYNDFYYLVQFPDKIDIQNIIYNLPDSIISNIYLEDIDAGILGFVQILLVLLCLNTNHKN